MARKRGGLAGIWDRNKQIIKPVATGLAGFFGTPALGAAVGAALGGFDRPGKSGIGFDVKEGALGGVKGYGMGALGSAAGGTALGQKLGGNALNQYGSKSGIGRLLGDGGPRIAGKLAAPTMANNAGPVFDPYKGINANTYETGRALETGATGGAVRGGSGGSGGGGGGSGLGRFGLPPIKGNEQAYAAGLQGIGQLSMSGAANKQADAEARLTDARISEMEYETEQRKRRDASLARLREMLGANMPTFGNSAPTSPWNK